MAFTFGACLALALTPHLILNKNEFIVRLCLLGLSESRIGRARIKIMNIFNRYIFS